MFTTAGIATTVILVLWDFHIIQAQTPCLSGFGPKFRPGPEKLLSTEVSLKWVCSHGKFHFQLYQHFLWGKKINRKTFQSDLDKFANIYSKKTLMADLCFIINMFQVIPKNLSDVETRHKRLWIDDFNMSVFPWLGVLVLACLCLAEKPSLDSKAYLLQSLNSSTEQGKEAESLTKTSFLPVLFIHWIKIG